MMDTALEGYRLIFAIHPSQTRTPYMHTHRLAFNAPLDTDSKQKRDIIDLFCSKIRSSLLTILNLQHLVPIDLIIDLLDYKKTPLIVATETIELTQDIETRIIIRQTNMKLQTSTEATEEVISDFATEFYEAYELCEVKLVELENTPSNQDLINLIFRAIHTVKGNLSFVGLQPLLPLLQSIEDLLSKIREGSLVNIL